MRKLKDCFLASIFIFPAFVGCAGGFPAAEGGGLANAACPANVGSVKSIANANFGLEAEIESRAKAALKAGAQVIEIAAEIEADVLEACTNIATDLGVPKKELKAGEGQSKVEVACKAAASAIADTRASIDAKATVEAEPPRCRASMDAMADCAAECEADIEPGEVRLECEGGELSGRCEGTCQGSCTVEGTADCQGTCSGECKGKCTGEIVGKCDGTCNGTCEGKNTQGKCDGTCRGKCDGNVEGQCSARCNGGCDASCEMQAKGECQGTCSGECSVKFEEPKCDGEMKAPEVSAECEAECNAKITAEVDCEPGRFYMNAGVSADTEAVEKLAATLKTNLPTLLRVSVSLKGRLESAVAAAEASVKGIKATVEAAGSDAVQVAGCFVASLQAQARASASIKVSVEASASASASATGGTG